jgi:hypothetical protein
VFSGSRYQRGHGLGSTLGGLFRSAVPFLKRGLASAGRYVARSGGRLIEDLQSGTDLKTAAQNRLEEAKRDALGALGDTLTTVGQSGRGRRRKRRVKRKQVGGRIIKKRRILRRRVKQVGTRRRRITSPRRGDIFD